MSDLATTDQPPSVRRESPSPDLIPTPAIGALPELSRCLSTSSDMSHGSGTDFTPRSSLGSDAFSRQSSASYGRHSDMSFASSRNSSYSTDGRSNRRRGYMRPQGTAFAASAQSRESVMSLGSIAHLQYYFARTGLLDGKGAQLQRKNKQNRGTLDFSAMDSSLLSPKIVEHDADSSYASMRSSPELMASNFATGSMVDTSFEEHYYSEGFDEEEETDMLPPTTSTYIHREKVVPRPPTIEELKADLAVSLGNASEALQAAKEGINQPNDSDDKNGAQQAESPRPRSSHHARQQSKAQGWFEIQGVHILDVMTLAIRAAKMYYTSHEHPERLDAIRPERVIRAELFAVMETLKQMATRRWAGGMRNDELAQLDSWIRSLLDMLRQEDEMEAAERAERAGWTWLTGDWTGRERERELAFLSSLNEDVGLELSPRFSPHSGKDSLPTPLLKSLQNGLRLIKLHNAAVKRSKRRFGIITNFHEDTDKPYRSADNLRYWVKAAELRWEIHLKIDPLGIVYNSSAEIWRDFEQALWMWCQKVREEITADLES